MKQTYDDGHRKKPNNENRKSNSKSVFRLSSARKIVGHLMAHSKLKNEKRDSATVFRFSRARKTNGFLIHAFVSISQAFSQTHNSQNEKNMNDIT